MGKTYLEAGQPLKAKAYFASLGFSFNSAVPAQYYLGEVHERLGDGEQARLHYAQFLRWFEGADPELQPWVERARQALQRLAAESAA